MKTKKLILFAMVIVTLLAGCQMTTLETFENPVLIYDGEVFGEADGNGRDLSASWEIPSSEKRIQKRVFYGEESETEKKANATAYAFDNKDLSMFLEFDPDGMGDSYLYLDKRYTLPDYRDDGASIKKIVLMGGNANYQITKRNDIKDIVQDLKKAAILSNNKKTNQDIISYYPIYIDFENCLARYYYGMYCISKSGKVFISCNDIDTENLYSVSEKSIKVLHSMMLV